MKSLPRWLSNKRALLLLAILAVVAVSAINGSRISPARSIKNGTLAGPTTVKKINDDIVEIAWNGGPKYGFVLSDVMKLAPGDRVEIFWMSGCFEAPPLRECNQPWGWLDVTPENRKLFRYSNGQFAIHVRQGRRSYGEVWPGGAKELLVVVNELPVTLYYNTMVRPGVYYGSANSRIPIDGYQMPRGQLIFRVVNRHH